MGRLGSVAAVPLTLLGAFLDRTAALVFRRRSTPTDAEAEGGGAPSGAAQRATRTTTEPPPEAAHRLPTTDGAQDGPDASPFHPRDPEGAPPFIVGDLDRVPAVVLPPVVTDLGQEAGDLSAGDKKAVAGAVGAAGTVVATALGDPEAGAYVQKIANVVVAPILDVFTGNAAGLTPQQMAAYEKSGHNVRLLAAMEGRDASKRIDLLPELASRTDDLYVGGNGRNLRRIAATADALDVTTLNQPDPALARGRLPVDREGFGE